MGKSSPPRPSVSMDVIRTLLKYPSSHTPGTGSACLPRSLEGRCGHETDFGGRNVSGSDTCHFNWKLSMRITAFYFPLVTTGDCSPALDLKRGHKPCTVGPSADRAARAKTNVSEASAIRGLSVTAARPGLC